MKHLHFAAVLPAALLAFPANAQELSAEDVAQSARWHNTQQAALVSLDPDDGWHMLEGGVRFRRIEGDGTGPAPTVRDIVKVNYEGRLTSGAVFDSNEGSDPVTFPLNRLIPAWQVAIPYMGVGDTAEIAVPAEMGYGARGGGPIPPYATLFFTIELLDVSVPPGA